MGRMLDILKQGESRRVMPMAEKSAADAAVQDCVVDWEIGAEVPFVEVGGPNKKVELSPGLMAHPAQAAPQPPHHVAELAPAVKSVELTAMPPMSVRYEALPGAAPGSISPDVIAFHQPDHPRSKEYTGVLDAMMQGLQPTKGKVLLLVGSKPRVGASTVLANLAVLAAKQLHKVAVMETCSARAGMSSRFGHAGAAGMCDAFAGKRGLEQVMAKTALDTLHLLPAGAKEATLTASSTAWLFDWMCERYDLIFLDGATLEDAGNLEMLVPHAQGIYVVLPHGDPAAAKSLPGSISRFGGRLCGLIHTRFEM